eukprot:6684960-Pyramimonas_sp.AAC.1
MWAAMCEVEEKGAADHSHHSHPVITVIHDPLGEIRRQSSYIYELCVAAINGAGSGRTCEDASGDWMEAKLLGLDTVALTITILLNPSHHSREDSILPPILYGRHMFVWSPTKILRAHYGELWHRGWCGDW